MNIDEVKEMTIEDFFGICEEEGGQYQIETPEGWQDINFLVKKKDKECYNLIVEENVDLGCSDSHQILTNNGWKKCIDINVEKDMIKTKNGFRSIISKEYIGIKDTFDLNVNSNEHSYYSNGIVSHNCGKSLVCKTVSKVWNMPLLKLDFGKLFGSLVGDSEKNVRSVLNIAELVSPSVLWLDEIEKAISGVRSSSQSDGGTTSRVLSTFLTWMQEKTKPVFVIATANEHETIPPEFLRAGRFDEIFYVDLPNVEERMEIYSIHLKKHKLDPKDFNLKVLSSSSENYSGAEIEKSIDNALLTGFADKKRKIDDKDILNALSEFKPLAKLKEEEFMSLNEWATSTGCRKANAEAKIKLNMGMSGAKDIDLE